MEAKISVVIDDPWLLFEPVRVGHVPWSLATPDRYVTVHDDHVPLMRVDIYSYRDECSRFEDAIVWRENLIMGFGSHVHVIAISKRTSRTIALESYFGHFYTTRDYLLIASSDRLLRIEPDGSILWTSELLALDGIVVTEPGPPVIQGDAEYDPPGGWKPFAISAANGRAVP